MDGLHALAANNMAVTIGGRELRLAPLRLVDFATIERHLLSQRPDPLRLVLAQLPAFAEQQQRHLLELAYEDACRGPRISHEELLSWIETATGRLFRLWLSLRRDEPSVTLAEVEQLLAATTPDEEAALREALELLSGNPWGN